MLPEDLPEPPVEEVDQALYNYSRKQTVGLEHPRKKMTKDLCWKDFNPGQQVLVNHFGTGIVHP